MKHKGNVWIIIFFLIILFIFTTTIDVNRLTNRDYIGLQDSKGNSIATTTQVSRSSTAPPAGEQKYKEFIIKKPSSQASKLVFDVNNQWMEFHSIDPHTMKVYVLDVEKKAWVEQNITEMKLYAIATLYSTATVTSSPYLIIGTKDSAPKKGKLSYAHKVLGLILIIIILLYIAYHKPKKSKKKKQLENKLIELQEYVKKALIEGEQDNTLRERLISAGWQREEIDEALKRSRYF